MKLNRIYILFALLLASVFALPSQSQTKSNTRDVVPAGGGASQSTKFKNFSTVGQGVSGSHSAAPGGKFSGTVGFLANFGQPSGPPVVAAIEEVYDGKVASPLTVSPVQEGAVYEWYSDETLTTLVNVGNPYAHTLKNVGETTYWVVAVVDGVKSEPTEVTVTITEADLTITAKDVTKTYGDVLTDAVGSTATTAFTAVGLQNDETIKVDVSYLSTVAEATASASTTKYANAVTITNPVAATAEGAFLATNYDITYVKGGVTINPKELTVSYEGASAITKVYDGLTTATPTGTAKLDGVIGTEAVTLGGTTIVAEYATKDVPVPPAETAIAIEVSGYELVGTTEAIANYTLKQPTLSGTITPKDLTIAAKTQEKYYGTTIESTTLSMQWSQLTCTGLVSGEFVKVDAAYDATTNLASTEVGTYTEKVTISNAQKEFGSAFKATNYAITYTPGTLKVNRVPLTITGISVPATKVYDGYTTTTVSGTPILTAGSAKPVGIYNNEALTVVGIGTAEANYSSSDVGDNITVTVSGYTIEGDTKDNYILEDPSFKANITRKSLTLTLTDESKTYGEELKSKTIPLNGWDVDVSFGSGGLATANVGQYTISGSLAAEQSGDVNNYNISITPGSLTVNPKQLTVTGIVIAEKTYDGKTAATITDYGHLDAAEIVNNDQVSLVTGGITGANFNDAKAGTKTVILSGAYSLSNNTPANYTVTAPNTISGTITKAPLTITAANKETCEDASVEFTADYTGFKNNETIAALGGALVITNSPDDFTAEPHTLTPGGFTSDNYAITFTPGTLTVNAKPTITLAAKTTDATYSKSVGAVELDYTETANGATQYKIDFDDDAENAGFETVNYIDLPTASPIDITVPAGAAAGTYNATLKVKNGTTTCESTEYQFTITIKKAEQDALNYADVTKIYGDDKFNHTATAGTITSTGAITYESSNPLVATINPTSGEVEILAQGITTLKATKAGDANFNATSEEATLTVDKKQLTIATPAITATKVYDGTDAVASTSITLGTVSGVLAVDAGKVEVTGTATYDDKNVNEAPATKTITLVYSISGENSGNYLAPIDYTTTSGAITPADLTITGITADDKEYDGTTIATISGLESTYEFDGLIEGDEIQLDFDAEYTATFNNKAKGTDKPVTVVGMTVIGDDAANYNFTQPTGLKADINSIELTIEFANATGITKEYDGTDAANITAASPALVGVITVGTTLDDVSLTTTNVVSKYEDKKVGTAKEISISGFGLSGDDADNYTLKQPTLLSGAITPKTLGLSGAISISDKTYNGNTSAAIANIPTLTGMITVGTATDEVTLDVTHITAAFADADAEQNKTVALSGTFELGGAEATNYTAPSLSQVTATASINKKSLTASVANATKCFGSLNPPFVITYSGFISGESETNAAGFNPPTATCTATQAGEATITLAGGSATNYEFTTLANGIMTIQALPEVTTEATKQSRCGSGTLVFTAVATSGSDIEWKDGSDDFTTTPIHVGNTFAPTIGAGETIAVYYRAKNSATGCTSAIYGPIEGKSSAATIAGTVVLVNTAAPVSIAKNTAIPELTVSGNNGPVVRWEKKVGIGTWSAIPNSATNTFSEVATIAGIWQYRAVVSNSPCSEEITSNAKTITVTSENVVPTLAANTYSITTPISVSVRFDKTIVNNLDKEFFTVTNGTATSVTKISSTDYTLFVTPNTDYQGIISVSMLADKVTDASNNTNDASNTVEVLFDNIAPVINTSYTFGVPSNTNQTITFDTRTENGSGLSKIYYTTNGTTPNTFTSTYVTAAENWQFTLSNEGTYTVQFFGVDIAENVQQVVIPANNNTVMIDRTAPITVDNVSLAVQTVANGDIIFSSTDALSGVSKIYYAITTDGTSPSFANTTIVSTANELSGYVTSTNNWKVSTNGLADGVYYVKYFAVDVAGNSETPVKESINRFRKDASAPLAPNVALVGSSENHYINSLNASTTKLTITGEVGTTYNYSMYSSSKPNAKIYGHGTIPTGGSIVVSINLNAIADGAITASVTLTDAGGLVSPVATVAQIKETTHPTVIINKSESQPNPTTSMAGITFTATFSEEILGVTSGSTDDFVVVNSNGQYAVQTPTDNVYPILITNYTSSPVVLNMNELNDITDIYGNPLSTVYHYVLNSIIVSDEFTYTISNISPSITNVSNIQFKVEFSATTYNFNTEDVDVITGTTTGSNTKVNAISSSDNKTYIVSISGMENNGIVQITIPTTASISNTIGVPISGSPKSTQVTWDNIAPTVASSSPYSPAAGVTGVPTDSPLTLILTMSEKVVKGTDGSIILRKVSDGQAIETFNSNSQAIDISDNVVTITSSVDLPSSTDLYVTISANMLKDEAGNSFAGLISTTAWYFMTTVSAPLAQVTAITGTQTKSTINLTVTKPVGTRIIVLAKAGTVAAAPPATDFNTAYNFGNLLVETLGYESVDNLVYTNSSSGFGLTGYKVVYAGDANIEYATRKSFTVSGLNAKTNYRFFAYAYNVSGSNYYYNTTIAPKTAAIKTNAYKIGAEDDEIGVETNANFTVSEVTPNPVDDEINFKVDSYEGSDFSFTIYNMAGQELYTTTQLLNKGMNQVTIPVEKLGFVSSGSYMIRVSDASGETIVPFVINR